jgi:hypothetical protein
MRRIGLAGVVLVAWLFAIVGGASASTLCLQLKPNGTVKGPTAVGGSTCKAGYEKIELPPAAQLETLNKVLPHMKYEEQGVAGKPTIQFSGVNVQVVSGAGKTHAAVNGEGNLVIGYDENPENRLVQTGSHNLVLGEDQSFRSYGGIVAGLFNTISGPFSSVTGGNTNEASGETSSVTGGFGNGATASYSSVTGGGANRASGSEAWVGSGTFNTASALESSVVGGNENSATQVHAWVGGGSKNTAAGAYSSVFGGKGLTASGEYEAIP